MAAYNVSRSAVHRAITRLRLVPMATDRSGPAFLDDIPGDLPPGNLKAQILHYIGEGYRDAPIGRKVVCSREYVRQVRESLG